MASAITSGQTLVVPATGRGRIVHRAIHAEGRARIESQAINSGSARSAVRTMREGHDPIAALPIPGKRETIEARGPTVLVRTGGRATVGRRMAPIVHEVPIARETPIGPETPIGRAVVIARGIWTVHEARIGRETRIGGETPIGREEPIVPQTLIGHAVAIARGIWIGHAVTGAHVAPIVRRIPTVRAIWIVRRIPIGLAMPIALVTTTARAAWIALATTTVRAARIALATTTVRAVRIALAAIGGHTRHEVQSRIGRSSTLADARTAHRRTRAADVPISRKVTTAARVGSIVPNHIAPRRSGPRTLASRRRRIEVRVWTVRTGRVF